MPVTRSRASVSGKDEHLPPKEVRSSPPRVDVLSVGPATPAQVQETHGRRTEAARAGSSSRRPRSSRRNSPAIAVDHKQAAETASGLEGEADGNNAHGESAENSVQGSSPQNTAPDSTAQNSVQVDAGQASRARFLEIARRRAAHFAHFDAEAGEAPAGGEASSTASKKQCTDVANRRSQSEAPEDWPGPFSTARRLVEGRAAAAQARKESLVTSSKASVVEWTPSRKPETLTLNSVARNPMSLFKMSLEILCANMEHVESLQGVPEMIKKVICARLCTDRKLDCEILRLLVDGSPSTISLPDCSFISEQELTEILAQCSRESIEVLDLKLCGRGLSDQCVAATLTPSPGMSNLHTLCVKGAYMLTDKGLSAIIKSAPELASLDLSLCPLISEEGIMTVAECLGSKLNSLCLEGCSHLNGLKLLPSLLMLKELRHLFLGGVGGIADDVVSELVVNMGVKLEELCLSDCLSVTDDAVAAIAACCSGLKILVLDRLNKLTDMAVARIADGCRSLRKLSFQRCKFSDDALAALVTASGSSLCEFSVNNVRQAGDQTLLALAKHARQSLEVLDASFCREMTDEALGFLADTCFQLHTLRLFGCTQVTSKFLDGHSNCSLRVLGLTNYQPEGAKNF